MDKYQQFSVYILGYRDNVETIALGEFNISFNPSTEDIIPKQGSIFTLEDKCDTSSLIDALAAITQDKGSVNLVAVNGIAFEDSGGKITLTEDSREALKDYLVQHLSGTTSPD